MPRKGLFVRNANELVAVLVDAETDVVNALALAPRDVRMSIADT